MLSPELLDELHSLSRTEKLRIVQMLVNDLAEEELIAASVEYPIYTPLGNEQAASILYKVLQTAKNQDS